MWIKREIENIFPKLEHEQPVLVLTGSRQVGKTSLLQHILPEAQLVSLDLPRLAEEAEFSAETFLGKLSTPCIIDEVQYAPTLFRNLKVAVDKSPKERVLYYLTGSEKFELMKEVSESLAGRCTVVELENLSHAELEKHYGKVSEGETLLKWIFEGGYPDQHVRSLDPVRFFENLTATYIERDVKRLSNVQNTRDFDRFLRLAALRSAQVLSMNSIASDLGVNHGTIKNWLGVLQASGIVSLLEPWNRNPNKRLIKTPKLYFHDTGLLCSLLGFQNARDILTSPLLGALFETHVFGQLKRYYSNRGRRPRLSYFRTHDGGEIDFVISSGTEATLIECKWSENPQLNEKNLAQFRKYSQETVRSVHLICSARGRRKKGNHWIEDSVAFSDYLRI